MVKVIDMYIPHNHILESVKAIEDYNNIKDIIITDVIINNDNTIGIKAVVSDEVIDRNQSLRYKY